MSDFNLNQLDGVDPSLGGGQVRPDGGDYTVMISKADTVTNNKGNGTNGVMEYTILDGNFQGTVLKEWLKLVHPSEKSQEIDRSKLKAIQVVAKLGAGTLADLVGKTIIVRINKVPSSFTNDKGVVINTFENNILMYMDMEHKNAAGKDVGAYVHVEPAAQPARAGTSNTSGGTNTASNQSKQDIDDEIPF